MSDLTGGKGIAHGFCVVTDNDNDKAFMVFNGAIDPDAGFDGDFQWTGGTGKYTGMKGNNTFRAIFIGATPEGRGVHQGEWQLP